MVDLFLGSLGSLTVQGGAKMGDLHKRLAAAKDSEKGEWIRESVEIANIAK